MRRLRNILLTATALMPIAPAFAGPDGGVVVGGTAQINNPGTANVTVHQFSDRAIHQAARIFRLQVERFVKAGDCFIKSAELHLYFRFAHQNVSRVGAAGALAIGRRQPA